MLGFSASDETITLLRGTSETLNTRRVFKPRLDLYG